MRRFLLALVSILLIVGVLAGVGFLGYRVGYRQGALAAASNDDTNTAPFMRGNDFGWDQMPMHGFGNGPQPEFQRSFGPGGFRIMSPGRGFGFFSPILFVLQLAILGFIGWLVYKLLTGWRLTLNRPAVKRPRVETVQPVESETQAPEEQSN